MTTQPRSDLAKAFYASRLRQDAARVHQRIRVVKAASDALATVPMPDLIRTFCGIKEPDRTAAAIEIATRVAGATATPDFDNEGPSFC